MRFSTTATISLVSLQMGFLPSTKVMADIIGGGVRGGRGGKLMKNKLPQIDEEQRKLSNPKYPPPPGSSCPCFTAADFETSPGKSCDLAYDGIGTSYVELEDQSFFRLYTDRCSKGVKIDDGATGTTTGVSEEQHVDCFDLMYERCHTTEEPPTPGPTPGPTSGPTPGPTIPYTPENDLYEYVGGGYCEDANGAQYSYTEIIPSDDAVDVNLEVCHEACMDWFDSPTAKFLMDQFVGITTKRNKCQCMLNGGNAGEVQSYKTNPETDCYKYLPYSSVTEEPLDTPQYFFIGLTYDGQDKCITRGCTGLYSLCVMDFVPGDCEVFEDGPDGKLVFYNQYEDEEIMCLTAEDSIRLEPCDANKDDRQNFTYDGKGFYLSNDPTQHLEFDEELSAKFQKETEDIDLSLEKRTYFD